MPKVSIIIPMHNSEAFIEETLLSCLDQSYQDIEIVVVENGSHDKSYEVVQALKDERIQLYKMNGANAAAARNYGYHKAVGEYITFLDADDVLSPNKIALQIEALQNKPKNWIASCAWAKFKHQVDESVIQPQEVWRIKNPLDWCISAMTGGGMMIPGCWLIPKHIIDKAGGWNESLSLHDDGEFMCRVLLASKGNVFVEDAVVYYRQVEDSLSKKNKSLIAAKSALAVYQSYEKQVLEYENTNRTREALAHNYCQLLYEFYPNYRQVLQQAKQHLKNLNVNPVPKVGSKTFKQSVDYLGFDHALKILAVKRFFN